MRKKILVIVRHGEAEQINKDMPHDYDRALTLAGREEARQTGTRLVGMIQAPIQIVASASKRTQQTADLIREQLGNPPMQLKENLFHARPDDWLREIHTTQPSVATLICVGHNPTVSELCSRLTGNVKSLGTGDAMCFAADGVWADLTEKAWIEILNP